MYFLLVEVKNPEQYLVNQQIGIKNNFEKALSRNKNLEAIVLKMRSNFKGTYFDRENNRITLDNKRPYYIWIIGTSNAIKVLMEELNLREFSEFQHIHVFSGRKIIPKYRITTTDRIGTFTFSKESPTNAIENCKASQREPNRRKFAFSVALDFKPFGNDESFILDLANYRLNNPDYKLSVRKIKREDVRKNGTLSDYSHFLYLETERLVSQKLTVEFLKNFPQWVDEGTSMNDAVQNNDELNKTFGFKYMVKGIDDAFKTASSNDESYFNITLNIKN